MGYHERSRWMIDSWTLRLESNLTLGELQEPQVSKYCPLMTWKELTAGIDSIDIMTGI